MTPSLRPELLGEFGMVASTHWLASGAGLSVLERGGNAFDAAVAAGLTLQVVQPHLNGPAGELSALLWSRDRGEPLVVCGQGVAPRRATIPEYRRRGLELVPGVGVLAACVPGAFDAWLLLLREFGTWRLQEVAQYAIGYAEHGYRASARLAAAIRESEPLLRTWPASAGVYLPAPEPGATVRNRVLAATYREIIRQSRGGSREREIECARETFYRGFVAEAIHGFSEQHDGLLDGDDLAGWHASPEAPVTLDFQGNTVCKVGPWSQGPVFLQQLALLDGFDLRARGSTRLSTRTRCSSARSSPSPTARPSTVIPSSPRCR